MEKMRNGIAEIRRLLGGGAAEDPHASRNGRRDRDDSVDPDGKPSLGGIPGFRKELEENPFGATPMSYRSGGQLGFAPLEIKVTVDGNAKVDAPQRILPVDRGPMLNRA